MMWHNQTFKCLYTLRHSVSLPTLCCNICIYLIFIATVGLQPTAGVLCVYYYNEEHTSSWISTKLAQKMKKCKHWNAPIVTECYNVESSWKSHCIRIIWSHMVCKKERFFSSPWPPDRLWCQHPVSNGGCFFLGIKLWGSVADCLFPPLYLVLGLREL